MRLLSVCKFNILLLCLAIVAPVHAESKEILILGDSLSAAYGIPVQHGWVSLLAKRLREHGFDCDVLNASISGETTTGALTRLPAILDQFQPDITLIELGANDGLRGFQPKVIKDNLVTMITQLRDTGSQVILVQIHLPTNYGQAYSSRFSGIYPELAGEYDLPLAPFILMEMFDNPDLMQADGLHPKAVAQPMILDQVWPFVLAELERD